jgi:2,5-diamino-6-(ribosylamino)-4(3H)-pyrimidinone 5'-phosphate reductase
MSMDGKIATNKGDSRLSDERDFRRVHKLRSEVDGIIVGIGTLLADDPKLTVKYIENPKNPTRIVVDSNARTPKNALVLTHKPEVPTIIAVIENAPKDKIEELKEAGANILICGSDEKVDLKILMEKLYNMGIRSLMLEGGGELNWSMIKNCLVDEIRLTISPKILGGYEAISLVRGVGFQTIDESPKFSLINVKKDGDYVFLIYKRI